MRRKRKRRWKSDSTASQPCAPEEPADFRRIWGGNEEAPRRLQGGSEEAMVRRVGLPYEVLLTIF